MAERVDLCTTFLSGRVTAPVFGECSARKLRAAGKNFAGLLECAAHELTSPGGFAGCDTKNDIAMRDAFTRADATGPCGGSFVTIEADIDACVQKTVEMLPASVTTTTTTSAPGSTTTTTFVLPPGCPHHPCTTGAPLSSLCGGCVALVCDSLPACCTTAWDFACVEGMHVVCSLCFP